MNNSTAVNYMSDGEILHFIKNYIDNTIYNHAILIDGSWGSGKTYFIKHTLIPVLKKEYRDKKIMYISLYGGAEEDLKFVEYVNFLADEGFIPPNGKVWVDHIRKKGNEANHEIRLMDKKDARDLIIFVEMLLKFIYEFPNMI